MRNALALDRSDSNWVASLGDTSRTTLKNQGSFPKRARALFAQAIRPFVNRALPLTLTLIHYIMAGRRKLQTDPLENYTFLTIVADSTGPTIIVAARTRNDCRFSNE
jgi:hypothetical protein